MNLVFQQSKNCLGNSNLSLRIEVEFYWNQRKNLIHFDGLLGPLRHPPLCYKVHNTISILWESLLFGYHGKIHWMIIYIVFDFKILWIYVSLQTITEVTWHGSPRKRRMNCEIPPPVAVLVLTVLNVKRNVKLKALTVQMEGIGSTTTVRNYQIKK